MNGGGQAPPPSNQSQDHTDVSYSNAPPYVPPLPPRNKKQPPVPPGPPDSGPGHNRNMSEPYSGRATHRRTPSDPPPRPAPPDIPRAIGIVNTRPSSYRTRTQSTDQGKYKYSPTSVIRKPHLISESIFRKPHISLYGNLFSTINR